MGTWFRVNKSGESIPVYRDSQFDEVVGSLNDREAFVDLVSEGDWHNICFLGPNGYRTGTLSSDTPNSVLTSVMDYPLDTVYFEGYGDLSIFKMRQTMNFYDAFGNYWGQVAEGCNVACKDDSGGENNTWYKQIECVQESSGQWFPVSTVNGPDYGFVDSGLRTGSGYGSIAFYGSW